MHYLDKMLRGMTYIPSSEPPDNYPCVTKVKNRLKKTRCGPVHSLHQMLSNLLEFDFEYVSELKIDKWTAELVAKVNILKETNLSGVLNF